MVSKMEPGASDTGALRPASVDQTKGLPYSHVNGISNFILPSRKESTMNVQDNLLTRSVENVMLGMEREQRMNLSSTNSHVPNHASQLLQAAAASAASNSYKSDIQLNGQSVRSIPPLSSCDSQSGGALTTEKTATSECCDRQVDVSVASLLSNQVTTVSFSSKPTMSTGFTTCSLTLPKSAEQESAQHSAQHSQITDSITGTTTEPDSSIATKSEVSGGEQILVPFLWRRVVEEGSVVYFSPSEVRLTSVEETKKYLLSEDTCKCGLQCPFHVEKVFNFDAEIPSRPWKLADIDASLSEPLAMSCCHRKHIRSRAMGLDCKNNNNKMTRSTPVKRKGKISRKSPASKSPRSIKSPPTSSQSRGRSDARDTTPTHQFTPPKPPVQPLPSVETVASQLRNSRSLEVTPPQLLSPSYMNSGISPRLLSPTHDQLMGSSGAYGLPSGSHVPPPSMMHSSQGYPVNPLIPYPMNRPPTDTAMMIPGQPSGYYPPQHMSPGYMNPFVHSFPNQPSYDHMPPRPPTWPATHPMVPPATQTSIPMWQPRPAAVPAMVAATGGQKRKRRPSSKSSNGGASDASFNSGLASPSLKSPPPLPSKNLEKKGMSPELANSVVESAIITDHSQETNMAVKSEKRPVHYAETNVEGVRAASRASVIQSPMQPTESTRFPGYAPRMPSRHPFPVHPNGIPMAAYMDPMYIPRQQNPPSLRPPYNMYPNMGAPPLNPFEQPRMRLPTVATIENTLSSSTKEPDPLKHSNKTENETSNKSAKECSSSLQKLPGINTITSSLAQHKPTQLDSQPPVNGFAQGPPTVGYNSQSVPATGADMSKIAQPPQCSPIHMLPGHNGHMFYRYNDPMYQGGQLPPMYFSHVTHPLRHSFAPSQYPATGFPYSGGGGNVSPNVSPKRKRRKTSKPAIESHSAHLASGTTNITSPEHLDNPPVTTTTTKQVNNNMADRAAGAATGEETIMQSSAN